MRHPLWLGHESMEEHLPGIAQAVRSVVERRSADELDLKRTVVTELELGAATTGAQLMRNVAGRVRSAELLSHLEFYCNYELHRRKTFWVDESLAWMLANTRVGCGEQLPGVSRSRVTCSSTRIATHWVSRNGAGTRQEMSVARADARHLLRPICWNYRLMVGRQGGPDL